MPLLANNFKNSLSEQPIPKSDEMKDLNRRGKVITWPQKEKKTEPNFTKQKSTISPQDFNNKDKKPSQAPVQQKKSPVPQTSTGQAQEISQKIQKGTLNTFTWIIILGAALLKDLLEIALNGIPVIGGLLVWLLALPCTIIIYLVLFQKGIISLWKNTSRLVISLSSMILDNIPVVNALPVTTLNVLILFLSEGAEKLKRVTKAKIKQLKPQTNISSKQITAPQPTASKN